MGKGNSTDRSRRMPRKPATKFGHLQKKLGRIRPVTRRRSPNRSERKGG